MILLVLPTSQRLGRCGGASHSSDIPRLFCRHPCAVLLRHIRILFLSFCFTPYPDLIVRFIVTKVLTGINSDPQTIQCIKYFYASVDKHPYVRTVVAILDISLRGAFMLPFLLTYCFWRIKLVFYYE